MRRSVLVFAIVVAIALSVFVTHKGGCDYIERKTYSVAGIFLDQFIERPDKVWLHMANSPKKLEKLQSRYHGIELDVVFHENQKKFENSHEKKRLEEHPLEATLSKVNFNQISGLWFDFKNLTSSNCADSLKELTHLVSDMNLRPSQVIVESPNWIALKDFHEAGFRTSLYLPDYTAEQLVKGGLAEKQIKEAVDSGNIDYVSFDGRYYADIQKFCDGKNFKMLTWTGPWAYSLLAEASKEIINDPRVDVVLVDDH